MSNQNSNTTLPIIKNLLYAGTLLGLGILSFTVYSYAIKYMAPTQDESSTGQLQQAVKGAKEVALSTTPQNLVQTTPATQPSTSTPAIPNNQITPINDYVTQNTTNLSEPVLKYIGNGEVTVIDCGKLVNCNANSTYKLTNADDYSNLINNYTYTFSADIENNSFKLNGVIEIGLSK